MRLLRVLEMGRSSGGRCVRLTRVRIIAATNRDPPNAALRTLRDDLSPPRRVPVPSAALRREGDADLIAELFFQLNERGGPESASRGRRFRQSANYGGRARSSSSRTPATAHFIMPRRRRHHLASCWPQVTRGLPQVRSARRSLNGEAAIYATLDHCQGTKLRCAEILGVSLKTLYKRLAAYPSADPRMSRYYPRLNELSTTTCCGWHYHPGPSPRQMIESSSQTTTRSCARLSSSPTLDMEVPAKRAFAETIALSARGVRHLLWYISMPDRTASTR